MKIYEVYFICEYVDYYTKESSMLSDHETTWASNKIEAIHHILQYLWQWNIDAQFYGNYRIPLNMHCEEN